MNNQPPKGTYDWLPEEFAVRKYIFDVWRQVCQRFGYQEYLTPLVEYADLYRAKSGEDVGGPELTVFEDRGGRELAIRPEMTPSVTRLVSQIYNAYPKPIRFFSIANFYRNEKPQRGRNREFWQLNFDIFGSDSFLSDLEILQMALEIMLAFGPPKKSFTLRINNRKLVNEILSDVSADILPQVFRILDKFEKLPRP
ncbi:MAG TPA: HisS family protein, partial [Alphaproteobacteria bacterium]|nr:HisS family protein [Alphaproteobacteria bacterium]